VGRSRPRVIGWFVFAAFALGSTWLGSEVDIKARTVLLIGLGVIALTAELAGARWRAARVAPHNAFAWLSWTISFLSYTAALGLTVVCERAVQIGGSAFVMWLIATKSMHAAKNEPLLANLMALWAALAVGFFIRANDMPLAGLAALGCVGTALAIMVRPKLLEPRDMLSNSKLDETACPSRPAEPSWAEHDSILHDLSNAMTASLFMVRDLSRALDKATEPSLGRARSLSQALVGELSQISEHIRSSRQSVRLQPVAGAAIQLAEPIEHCVEVVSRLYPNASCRVECDPSAREALVSIIGGEATLKRIVENLILNACQAQAGTPKKIEVVCRIEAADDAVLLSVEDNGPGFPKVILDSFPSPSVSTKPQGTGIGLYSCHQLVKRDGGVLALSNLTTGGAKALVSWPNLTKPATTALQKEPSLAISGTRSRPEQGVAHPSPVVIKS